MSLELIGNAKIIEMEYAVRGPIPQRATELRLQGKKTIPCNIGNPQALGQAPITFYREVLSLLDHPSLIARERQLKRIVGGSDIELLSDYVLDLAEKMTLSMGSGVGAYSDSHGSAFIREAVARFIDRRDGVTEIFLAIESDSRQRRRAIIRSLEDYPVTVKILPAIKDIASGKVEITDLRPIDVEDLLGRDPVPPDARLLGKYIRGKNVMITGAGGSIGSELTRQIVKLSPKRLILFDISEVALYEIEQDMAGLLDTLKSEAKKAGGQGPRVETVAVLGSVLDGEMLRHTLAKHGVETIYHAAAYKHVPIVEQNPMMGLQNNIFGTLVLSQAAIDAGVERMVLISTDKAVRPTSVMGASKRISEMILQGIAAENEVDTVFTMVRFGNVLDSSGSVVRRFRKQIRNGGPITVTHPDIIRYFMSIPEAAELVLQAGAMATGGEVFVLDMGSPVKIDDLARMMIRLSGLEVCDEDRPDGDISIEYVGLRQGEKLYEELLIGENTTGTKHPRIMKNSEPHIKLSRLNEELQALGQAIDDHDIAEVQAILNRTVEGYAAGQPSPEPESGDDAGWAQVSRLIH